MNPKKRDPISKTFNSLQHNVNQLQIMRMLSKTIKNNLDFILNRDLLSEENLYVKRKEIKRKMEKEMAEGETAMMAIRELIH